VMDEQYRSLENGIGTAIEDLDRLGKLGQGIVLVDALEEVYIGSSDVKRPTYVNAGLDKEQRRAVVELLKGFVDCSAWDYTKMPGLDSSLMEHRLPIKQGFRPYRQPARSFDSEVMVEVIEKIERLLKAGFIEPCRYAEWISNIVLVEKKGTGNLRVCLDFRNLNQAIPKDEYPLPVAKVQVKSASGHKIISFLDGNAGYNQVFMAKEDVHKTVFRCPRCIGLFEWVVMTFRLKNTGTTYQCAMNLIFLDLLGGHYGGVH
jgi:hypothetical protein